MSNYSPPTLQTLEITTFAAHRLHTLSAADALTLANPNHTTNPSNSQNLIHHPLYPRALSFVSKLQDRLPSALYKRFLQILADYRPGVDDIRRTKGEIVEVFEEAGEGEMLGEFLEGFMPRGGGGR
ncbi:MAG: hypothetical protein Q9220_003171 [cf. Caloplaca sp. 1 TL-2023]